MKLLALLGAAAAADKLAVNKPCEKWDACAKKHSCASYTLAADAYGTDAAAPATLKADTLKALQTYMTAVGNNLTPAVNDATDGVLKASNDAASREAVAAKIRTAFKDKKYCLLETNCDKTYGLGAFTCMKEPAKSGAAALGASLVAAVAVAAAI